MALKNIHEDVTDIRKGIEYSVQQQQKPNVLILRMREKKYFFSLLQRFSANKNVTIPFQPHLYKHFFQLMILPNTMSSI